MTLATAAGLVRVVGNRRSWRFLQSYGAKRPVLASITKGGFKFEVQRESLTG